MDFRRVIGSRQGQNLLFRNLFHTLNTCGDCLPSVPKTAVNQRFLQFWKKNRCVFQFPQSGYEGIDLPQGIGFGEREVYILAKGYFFAKEEEVDSFDKRYEEVLYWK